MIDQLSEPQSMDAVLYLRISDKAQEKKGSGLASQEALCREYASFRGYRIDKVFREVLSGGSQDRPAMTELLGYLRQHRKSGRVVIIDDISRFARDIRGHWALREELKAAGGFLESPRIKFADDADSVFNENILASVAQHQRQKNAEQTKNRMRGRVMNGYWPFRPCMGYRHERKSGHGMLLVRNEPLASIVQEGLEGYASGRFRSQAEVKRFFESHAEFPTMPGGETRFQYVTDILKNPIYAGYVESPKWNVSIRKGQHEGLITFEQFERIQEKLKEFACVPYRTDIALDFPLRGSVACGCCGRPLTAAWSTSKTGVKHPYYACYTKGCEVHRKSIRRDVIEGEFSKFLQALVPSKKLLDLATAMFKDIWNQRSAQAARISQTYENQSADLDKQIEGLLDRIVETQSETVIKAYEKRIAELDRQKILLREKVVSNQKPKESFDELFELALRFLANPYKLWESGDQALRKLVLRLTFSEHLQYCRNEGFRTPKTTMPFKLLEGFREGKKVMARSERFELPTPRFVVWCSIQLSYERIGGSELPALPGICKRRLRPCGISRNARSRGQARSFSR
jgi:site-specific DNA recombinase